MSFSAILSESVKLLPKNGKLMSIIALFSMVLTSSVLWLFLHLIASLSADIFVTSQQSFMPNPTIPGFSPTQTTGPFRKLQQDLAIILGVQIAFILVSFTVSFFSNISTILISAMSYKANKVCLKELLSIICRKWMRPLITTFYVTTLAMGYFLVVSILAAPLLVYRSKVTLSVAIVIGVVAFVFYLHLSVSWVLAVVVSVVEESYGLKSLGKAAALVEGKRLQGFLINVCFELLALIIYCGYKGALGYKGLLKYPMMYGLFAVIYLVLVKVFVYVWYTVLFFKCKEDCDEGIELHENVEYTKMQNTELGSVMA